MLSGKLKALRNWSQHDSPKKRMTSMKITTRQSAEEDDDLDPDRGKSEQQVIDEITGQLNLFPDENE